MNKKNLILIIVLSVLAVGLLAVYLIFKDDKPKEPEEQTPAYFVIREVPTERINRISLKTAKFDGTFKKNVDRWVNEGEVFPVNQSTVNVIVSVIASNLNAFERVNNPSAPEDYGFASPNATLWLYDGEEELLCLYVGNKLPTQNRYYAMVEGDASVYVVSDNYYSYLVKEQSDFLENVTLPSIDDSALLREVTVEQGGETVFHAIYDARNPYDYSGVGLFNWYILEPLNGFANADLNDDTWYGQMDRYLHISYQKLVDYRPTGYQKYGLDNPSTTVVVRYADSAGNENLSYTILFGSTTEDGGIYAKIDGMEWVFLMDSEMAESWNTIDIFGCCYKTVFFPTAKEFNSITVRAGGNEWIFVNKSTDADEVNYALNGSAISSADFNAWSQKLLSLKYSERITTGEPGKEILTIETDMKNQPLRKNMTIRFYAYSDAVYLVSVNDKIDFTIDVRKVNDFIDYMNSLSAE
jgi:hypothetical protein